MALREYDLPGSPAAPQERYQQQTLDNVEAEEPPPVTIDNCVVISRPSMTKHKNTPLWTCNLAAEPDIFHPDRHELIEVRASQYAKHAQKKQIKPGDRVIVTGIAQTQEFALANGERRTIHHLMLSDMKVIERARRISITVYERERL